MLFVWQESENNLDELDGGCCCDITPDKAEVIVNRFNITATGEEDASKGPNLLL